MACYRWCDLSVSSDLELPELPLDAERAVGAVRWSVTLEAGQPPRRRGRRWFHHWRLPNGRRWVAFARDPDGYLLRFPHLADFDIQPSRQSIACYPSAGTPDYTLRHLLLDQVLPLVAGGPDRLALHGSVVATARGALVFLGDPGHGKSTLAAQLARHGCPLVSDDCCLLVRTGDGFAVAPSYPGVRLAPDSVTHVFGALASSDQVAHYTAKVRVADEAAGMRFFGQSLPLVRVYVIAPMEELHAADRVRIEPRRGSAALFDLLNYTFHLDVQYAPRLREAFELAADIVLRHDVRRLLFPWELATAEAVAQAVLADD